MYSRIFLNFHIKVMAECESATELEAGPAKIAFFF